ncbi:MAG: pilus assembly protein PilM [Candidatus Moranbacteria bacterium]|nr:pilus assembly protein PilM [Candidatus Moranbacteria bacterium]
MGLFSGLSLKRETNVVLALDIGTEVVKALVFRIEKNEKRGVVIGVGRAPQKIGNMQSGAVADISGVIESSRQAIALAKEQSGVKNIEKSIIGIAGELVKGTTTTVHYERVNPEMHIGVPELKMIIQKVQEKAYERIKRQISFEMGKDDVDVKLINAAIVDVRIDGYPVVNPVNFQGRDVSMSVFNAYAPMVHLGALHTIAEELDLDLLSIAAEPYAVARSVEVDDMIDFSAIFIDIGGGTTDIAVVRNGGLEGTKMFALGGRAFTKRLAQEFQVSFDVAEKMKIDYSNNRLDNESAMRVAALYADDCRIWLGGVELSLIEFAETDLLPPRIFLCGGGSALPGIKQALLSQEWSNFPFPKIPQVSFLQPRDVARIVDATGELNNPQDMTPIGLANLALMDILEEEKMLSSILRRSVEAIEKK